MAPRRSISSPLLALGDRAEALFGRPQDIEWTYRGGGFYLVQSRDITRAISGDADAVAVQNDLTRAVELAKGAQADEIVFAKNELSEMLPRPTPLSLSLMEALWAVGRQRRSRRAPARPHLSGRGRHAISGDHSRPALHRQARGTRARACHRSACCAAARPHGRSHRARFPRCFPAAVLRRKPDRHRGRLRAVADARS